MEKHPYYPSLPAERRTRRNRAQALREDRRRTTVRRWGLAGALGPMLLAPAGMAIAAVGVSTQAYWQPQPAPLVSAENQAWFRSGEPIAYEGYVYYPAGARVFFDGNVMVRAGAFRGIPIYIDTTIEAFSRIFIPAGLQVMSGRTALASSNAHTIIAMS